METNAQQLELFSGSGGTSQGNIRGRNTFLGYVRGYERIILTAISFILTAAVAFSLGVEKGKRLAQNTLTPRFDTALNAQPQLPQAKPIQIAQATQLPAPVKTQAGNYTIQLASFQNKTSADKESVILKKQGVPTLVLTKGNYIIVCTGSFPDKESAKPLLTQLRKKYQDSIIRRL